MATERSTNTMAPESSTSDAQSGTQRCEESIVSLTKNGVKVIKWDTDKAHDEAVRWARTRMVPGISDAALHHRAFLVQQRALDHEKIRIDAGALDAEARSWLTGCNETTQENLDKQIAQHLKAEMTSTAVNASLSLTEHEKIYKQTLTDFDFLRNDVGSGGMTQQIIDFYTVKLGIHATRAWVKDEEGTVMSELENILKGMMSSPHDG